MGIVTKIIKTAAIGTTAGVGSFFIATRKCGFVPMDPTTLPLFSSKQVVSFNPNNNLTTHDDCVRSVPISKIRPELLENKGELVKAFCAGVWGGPGYGIQRRVLERKYYGPDTKAQLWSPEELKASAYDVGTQITDHFEVVEKTPESIVVRCGDSPRIRDVRMSEGVFEMAADVKPEKGVVEFHLRSVFWQGLGKAEKPPMDGLVLWLHMQYDKVLMEGALLNVKK